MHVYVLTNKRERICSESGRCLYFVLVVKKTRGYLKKNTLRIKRLPLKKIYNDYNNTNINRLYNLMLDKYE
jgi:hypothetical protein